jgi:DNA-binding NarL/FixJ family response regulator
MSAAVPGNTMTLEESLREFATAVRLSPTQGAIFRAAVLGEDGKKTAGDLGCSESTLRTHWKRILAKLGVTSRQQAVTCFVRSVFGGSGAEANHPRPRLRPTRPCQR